MKKPENSKKEQLSHGYATWKDLKRLEEYLRVSLRVSLHVSLHVSRHVSRHDVSMSVMRSLPLAHMTLSLHVSVHVSVHGCVRFTRFYRFVRFCPFLRFQSWFFWLSKSIEIQRYADNRESEDRRRAHHHAYTTSLHVSADVTENDRRWPQMTKNDH